MLLNSKTTNKRNISSRRFSESGAGFTIVEMLVVISLFVFLMVGASSALIIVFLGSKQQYLALDNVDNARIVSSRFVNEIRSAVPGVDGSAAISQANDSEIIFHSPDRANGLANRIRYYISNNILYKAVTVPTGQPLAYNLDSESTSTVQRDLVLGGEPLFYYYDGDYEGNISPLSQPVNIPSIRYVRINLVVLKQTEQGSQSTFSLSTGATVRSLKDNLGN